MKVISAKVLSKFLSMAGDRLKGDWVIIGGASLLLLDKDARVTVDIDIAGPKLSTQEDTITLMEIADSLGLPVEAVNQAGAFFLRQITDWRDNLLIAHRGKTAVIFRPNATLFTLLKIKRLTETDLHDCLRMISLARQSGDAIDRQRVKRALKDQMRNCDVAAKVERYRALLNELLSAEPVYKRR